MTIGQMPIEKKNNDRTFGNIKMILLIDDMREITGADLIARTYYGGLIVLKKLKGQLHSLYLDHDLGSTTRTGYDLLKYGLENGLIPNEVVLVTNNPVGFTRMSNLLYDYNYIDKQGVFIKQELA